ncbi:hypothetical protein BH10BAC1_BH10BAC1_12320 [soil metagenome]
MKLENKTEKVVPVKRFIIRLLRYSSYAGLLIIFSVGIGVLGYHHFAQLNWLDSFHMACLILTGMGPVAEMKSSGAKLFDSIYALYSGVAFLSICAVFFAPIVHRIMHILHVDDEE